MSKHKPIPKSKRIKVWGKYNHHCAYCGCELNYEDMQVDHIEPIYSNNDLHKTKTLDELNEMDNLMPTCRACNYYKSSGDVEYLRSRITNILVRNLQASFDYKLALKYGLIKEDIKPIKFYFEKGDNL